MQKKVQFSGIVLKNIDYQDNAQIVYILTKNSIDSILIRGTKKIESKTRPLAQLITKIKGIKTDGSKMSTLTEGVVEESYIQIKDDIVKTQAVLCIFEKIYSLYPNISDSEKIYDFLEKILSLMVKTNYPRSLLLLFEIKFWYLLGINPDFTNCVNCGKEIESGFLNINEGGLICHKCSNVIGCDLNIENSKIVKYLYHIKMDKVDDNFLSLIEIFYEDITKKIDKYYEKYIDFYNKSKEIFYKVI